MHWYQATSPLKLMIDRLVCADGGNPDPTTTHGKKPDEAKALELKGWDYPKHLAGRAYGVVVHGDVAGIESLRRDLCDWLDWMGLVDAGAQARLDRYIGYYEPYATSHDALDEDTGVQEEVRNVARAVARRSASLRAGRLDAARRRPASARGRNSGSPARSQRSEIFLYADTTQNSRRGYRALRHSISPAAHRRRASSKGSTLMISSRHSLLLAGLLASATFASSAAFAQAAPLAAPTPPAAEAQVGASQPPEARRVDRDPALRAHAGASRRSAWPR